MAVKGRGREREGEGPSNPTYPGVRNVTSRLNPPVFRLRYCLLRACVARAWLLPAMTPEPSPAARQRSAGRQRLPSRVGPCPACDATAARRELPPRSQGRKAGQPGPSDLACRPRTRSKGPGTLSHFLIWQLRRTGSHQLPLRTTARPPQSACDASLGRELRSTLVNASQRRVARLAAALSSSAAVSRSLPFVA